MGGGVVVKDFGECGYFEARDGCMLAEAMHPARETLPFRGYSIARAYIEPRGRTFPARFEKFRRDLCDSLRRWDSLRRR